MPSMLKSGQGVKDMSQTRVRLNQIEEGAELRDLLSWFKRLRRAGFAERFDAVWTNSAKAARKAGYRRRDVARLVAEVREAYGGR